MPSHSKAYSTEERQVICSKYKTLHVKALELLHGDKSLSNESIWYSICSSESIFKNLQNVIRFSLRFLMRDQNEYSVESLISNVESIQTSEKNGLKFDSIVKPFFSNFRVIFTNFFKILTNFFKNHTLKNFSRENPGMLPLLGRGWGVLPKSPWNQKWNKVFTVVVGTLTI